MKLAISNIAWKPEDDGAIAETIRAAGADAVELAPTAYWPDPLAADPDARKGVREAWARRGLPVVALQSLLFGYPELNLFDETTRPELRRRLRGMLEVAADLGAGPLVLGSPKNRLRRGLAWRDALAVAVPFFRDLGDEATRLGVCLCIEPNPIEYGCDFVSTAAEGRELVEQVGSPGFRLHLDAAGLWLAGDDPAAEVSRSIRHLAHVHLSAPQLGPVAGASPVDYAAVVVALRGAGYQGCVSIEMRAAPDRQGRQVAVQEALRLVRPLL